ncbi:MAG: hypothetical protein HW413_1694 [Thermoleophilia bacterium]|nr:hypothetical protein [Thermoleophilia bacterium]
MADPSETTQVSHEPANQESEELLAAVRALATQVAGLQSELQTLRAQPRSLPVPDEERPGWDDRMPAQRESAAWVRSLDTPAARRAAVPWLALEIVFIVAVAVLAVIAGLDAPAVVAVMVGAWLLVALAEWTAARAARRDDALVYGTTAPVGPAVSQDPSWFAPPVERTALEITDVGETTPARLPPPPPE